MKRRDDKSPATPEFIKNLMPGASQEELEAACEAMKAYLAVVQRIYEDRHVERQGDSRESDPLGTIRTKPQQV